jgi:hypothetical protein
MPRNKTRAIEDIDISIALVDFWMSLKIDQCKLNDIVAKRLLFYRMNAIEKGNHVVAFFKGGYNIKGKS